VRSAASSGRRNNPRPTVSRNADAHAASSVASAHPARAERVPSALSAICSAASAYCAISRSPTDAPRLTANPPTRPSSADTTDPTSTPSTSATLRPYSRAVSLRTGLSGTVGATSTHDSGETSVQSVVPPVRPGDSPGDSVASPMTPSQPATSSSRAPSAAGSGVMRWGPRKRRAAAHGPRHGVFRRHGRRTILPCAHGTCQVRVGARRVPPAACGRESNRHAPPAAVRVTARARACSAAVSSPS